jgi:hypothetical protein
LELDEGGFMRNPRTGRIIFVENIYL